MKRLFTLLQGLLVQMDSTAAKDSLGTIEKPLCVSF